MFFKGLRYFGTLLWYIKLQDFDIFCEYSIDSWNLTVLLGYDVVFKWLGPDSKSYNILHKTSPVLFLLLYYFTDLTNCVSCSTFMKFILKIAVVSLDLCYIIYTYYKSITFIKCRFFSLFFNNRMMILLFTNGQNH